MHCPPLLPMGGMSPKVRGQMGGFGSNLPLCPPLISCAPDKEKYNNKGKKPVNIKIYHSKKNYLSV